MSADEPITHTNSIPNPALAGHEVDMALLERAQEKSLSPETGAKSVHIHAASICTVDSVVRESGSISADPARRPNGHPRETHRIKSPIFLIVLFLVGLGLSLSHCLFYMKLDGKVVGNAARQEENLRMGTALAFLSQITLSGSVWLAYSQWLWRTAEMSHVSLKGLSAVFSLDTSIVGFLNLEIWEKFKVVSVMALLGWSHILAPFFTPGTLVVYPSTEETTTEEQRPSLAIANASYGINFAYSPGVRGDTFAEKESPTRRLIGPRTILTLLGAASVSSGRILDIEAPHNHSQYDLTFFGPMVKCGEADAPTAEKIQSLLEDKIRTGLNGAKEVNNTYYAFVPYFDNEGKIYPQARPRFQAPSNYAVNELWMSFSRYFVDDKGFRHAGKHNMVCRLWNATYNLHLRWDGGFQNVTGTSTTHNLVEFPNDKGGTVSDMVQHAYSAYMWVLADQLIGTLSWYEDKGCDPVNDPCATTFGVIDTQIQHTSILGSSDLDAFFDLNEEKDDRGFNKWPLSDQRKQDKDLAQNRTLDVLIEELAFNTTASFMHNELLCQNVSTLVTRWEDVNRYGYQPIGLLVPYCMAISLTFVTTILALVSYFRHGVMPDKDVENIVPAAAEDPRIAHIASDRGRLMTIEMVGIHPILRPGDGEKRETRQGRRCWV